MSDLLATIQAVDPLSAVLWFVVFFAAGMYPIGFMLGSNCSPCCPPEAICGCTSGALPNTVTLTFSGMTEKTPGEYLCPLVITAPYGYGASGKVTEPGGDKDLDSGPIQSVSVTSPGSGYAMLGRVAPTITASGVGTGADITVSISSDTDVNGIPTWHVDAITFTDGGSGYVNGEFLTISASVGDTTSESAVAQVITVRSQPTVTATVSGGGTGATVSFSLTANSGSPLTWSVTGLTLTASGTGYPNSGSISFSVSPEDTEDSAASAGYYCARTQPTVSLQALVGGSGAALAATLSSATGLDGLTYWYVSGISISNGGTGYSNGDQIALTVTDGQATDYSFFSASVDGVDGNGAITSVAIGSAGEFFKNTGSLDSVFLNAGGAYYKYTGEIEEIVLVDGGSYYREDASEPPYVAPIAISIDQGNPSNGTGAVISANVDDDTSSPTFGRIVSFSIDDPGDDYLAYVWVLNCLSVFDGRTIVLQRSESAACYYSAVCAIDEDPQCTPTREEVSFYYFVGPEQSHWRAMVLYDWDNLEATPDTSDFAYFDADCVIENCTLLECNGEAFVLPAGLYAPQQATATVTPVGEYAPIDTCKSFFQDVVEEIQVTFSWMGKSWTARLDGVPTEEECDTSYAFPYDGFPPTNPKKCGQGIGAIVTFAGECDGYLYGGVMDIKLASHCGGRWLLLGFNFSREELGTSGMVLGGFSWDTATEIPVDEDGYPDGIVDLRHVGTIGDDIEGLSKVATLEFSRILP